VRYYHGPLIRGIDNDHRICTLSTLWENASLPAALAGTPVGAVHHFGRRPVAEGETYMALLEPLA